jgi:serine/threonine-protein kinase
MGVIRTQGAPPDHRIYVDERVVGQTPESVTVKCGSHSLRIGSAGATRTVDVPCGAAITEVR